MADSFTLLLDAAIKHLQRLKDGGVRYVPVSAEALGNLTKPIQGEKSVRPKTPPTPPLPSQSTALVPAAPAASKASPLPPAPDVVSPRFPSDESGAPTRPVSQAMPESAQTPQLSSSPSAIGDGREVRIAELRARALACQKCPHLAATRRNVVFGVGDIRSPLMFVGEAPGADEDAKGEPFVGAAGQLLTKIIQTMGFSRETVYIANVLKCRPDTPGQTSGNRKPTGDEMKTCLPYLLEQIDLIQPKVIVALGATAVEGLLGLATPISKLRGSFQSVRGIPVMTTYHPAYLLRNQALSEKRKLWEDMLKVLEKLEWPVSEKQRGYFLRS